MTSPAHSPRHACCNVRDPTKLRKHARFGEDDDEGTPMRTDYDLLAARAERGDLTVRRGTVLRGVAAAAGARRALDTAAGKTSAEPPTAHPVRERG